MNKLNYIKLSYDGVNHEPIDVSYAGALPGGDKFSTYLYNDTPYSLAGFMNEYQGVDSDINYVVYIRLDKLTEEYCVGSGRPHPDVYYSAIDFIMRGVISRL